MKKQLFIAVLFLVINSIAYSQSANWSAVQPNFFPTNNSGQIHGISRVSQLKFHPTNASKMYAISARGGLFITSNGGTNWTVAPGTDFMPSARLASVCIDYTNDQILYLGTGDHNYYYSGSGVWKSTNGGTTFSQIGLSGRLVFEMIMDPTDHNIIVAGTDAGIYKTTNGGTTWTLKTTARQFDDVKQKTPTSRVLYAGTTDSAFFRSADFGNTWTQITTGIVMPSGVTNGNGVRVAVTPADTNIVYLGLVANGGMIYKSTNGGTSFTAIKTTSSPYLTYYTNSSTSSSQGDYNFGIGVDRTNANIIYLVAHNVWKSTDGGANWTQLTNWYATVHTDMHQIITNPYDNTKLYDMNDGGVWLSTDGGTNWSPKSDGINGYEIYHGTCSPTRRDMISIGTQDNGELYATSSGWFTNRGGDWQSHCVFDYRANSSMVYYFYPDWGTVSVPKRRLVTGSAATYGLPANTEDITDITFNRSNTDLAFAADTLIYRTTNLSAATPTWTSILNTGKRIMAIHSSMADANRLYIITTDGTFYVSTNALSATPTFTTSTLPNTSNNNATITTIANNSSIIYVTLNTKVYRSANNGSTWTNITYNLPSVNHNRIISDEYFPSNELVFVSSNNTVYYKTGTATSWTIFDANLPQRTTVEDMSIYNDGTSNTLLRVATYGRGVWETPITSLRTLTANFAADNTNPCSGANVTFSDLSTGNVTSRLWTFTGGTPSSSTAINPLVTYSSPGTYDVTLQVGDGITTNTITRTAYINTNGGNLPIAEGFEGTIDPPSGWKNIDNGTAGNLWTKTSLAGGFGNSAFSMLYDNYSWNVVGQRDELQTLRMDFTGYNTAQLKFDVAYQVYTGYADSLIVLISTNCGTSFSRLYAKGGSVLSTSGSGSADFVPTSGQWRTETINLNSYVGQSSVIIQFQNYNGYGNKLYVDNVNINATVPVNAGVDKTICSGTSTTIGSASSPGISYSWSPSTGLSSSTVSNPTASPTVTTQYILTATQTTSLVSTRDTVIVNVTTSPTVGSTATATTVCAGTPVTLTGTGATTYSWTGGITNGVAFTPTVGTTTYTVTGTTSGCSATSTQTITVNAMPTVGSTATATTVCAGTPVTLTGTGATTYSWTGGITNGVAFTPTAGTTTYTVTGTTSGCSATSTKTITVNAIPTLGITATATTVCAGTPVTLTGTGATAYSWTGGITNGVAFTPTVGTTTYTVTGTTSGCSATSTKTITVNAIPTVGSTATATTVCAGTPITLTGTGATTYSWTGGITNGTAFTPTVGTTTYTVTGTTSGCSATSTQAITVNPNYIITSTAGTNGTITPLGAVTVCSGGSQTYTIAANSGYNIADVLIDGVSNAGAIATGTYTFTNVSSGHTISASFSTSCIQPAFTSCSGNITSGTLAGFCTNAVTYSTSISGTSPVLSYSHSGATTGSGAGNGSGNTFNRGITHVIISASNTCGTAYCSFDIIINDTEAPVPNAVSLNTLTAECSVAAAIPSATDNCSGIVYGTTADSMIYSSQGTHIIHWIYDDGNGNVATQNQTVIINDVTPPAISAPADVTACFGSAVNLGTPVTSDNCGVASVTNNAPASFALGITSVQWTVTDYNGNTATALQQVTVNSLPTGSAAGSTICNGSASNIALSSNTPSATFSWTSSVTSGNILGNSSCSSNCGSTIADILMNQGTANGTVQYNITPISPAGCSGTVFTAVVTVRAPLAAPSVTGASAVCGLTTGNYTATSSGATGYTWTVPTGVTLNTGQGTSAINVTYGATITGNMTVRASNTCGTSSLTTKTIVKKPATPGAIQGTISLCGLTTAIYSIAAVTGATSYTWTVPTGITISSGAGTTSIHVTVASTFISGAIGITAVNSCGSTAGVSLTVYGKVPAATTAISGPTNLCGVTTATYTATGIPGATGYVWTLPAGVSQLSAAANSITVQNTAFSSGSISVQGTNVCGVGAIKSLVLTKAATTPGVISGPTVTCGLTTAAYSIAAVTGAVSYTWTIPAGATISSGQGTTRIVTAFATPMVGNVSVTSYNGCANSTARTLAVNKVPATPGQITGPAVVCTLTTAAYSIAAVAGTTNYLWQVPAGLTITSGQGTTAIVVGITHPVTAGQVKVYAQTSCGNSAMQGLSIGACAMPNAELEETFALYPNPTSAEFTIDISSIEDRVVDVQLYDVLGNLVLSKKETVAKGSSAINTNIEQMNNGIYFVRLLDAKLNVMYTAKVVKE